MWKVHSINMKMRKIRREKKKTTENTLKIKLLYKAPEVIKQRWYGVFVSAYVCVLIFLGT